MRQIDVFLSREEWGIYLSPGGLDDALFWIQQRASKIVYSHETPLEEEPHAKSQSRKVTEGRMASADYTDYHGWTWRKRPRRA